MSALRGFRAGAAIITIAIVIGSSMLPAEHVHFTVDAEGHLRALIHQHFSPHQWGLGGGGAHLLDSEEGAHYLDQSANVPSPFHVAIALPTRVPATLAPDARDGHARPLELEPFPHGPPRATASLRAPPRSI